MAEAKRVEQVVTVVRPAGIELHLTEAEGEVLRQIFDRIGGDPFETARGIVAEINAALRSAGVQQSTHPISPYQQSIYFEKS